MLLRPHNASLDAAVPTGSETSAHLHMPYARESGDLAGASPRVVGGRQSREGDEPQAVAHASEESRALVVPEKPANSEVTPEESVEGRGAANGKLAERNTLRAQDRQSVHTHLLRVGERARENKQEQFTNLLSHIKLPLLREAYQSLKRNAAAGVDGETWAGYGEDLDARLTDLQDRVHRGSYHPQPVRRVQIPKPDGRTRPLGIPTLEDKVVQQAVRMLLEPIYEADFLGFSYGFRPNRSQHKALDALYVALGGKANWVLDVDVRSFFDTIDHGWMRKFIEHRIGDTRLVRLLLKWLKAGVMEEGKLRAVESGTPQGGIISPLLANVYLHYALDLWAHQWRKRNARGEVRLVRYADDLVICFQHEQDARAMHTALAERLAMFSLELHPEKTRLLRFGRFARRDSVLDQRKRPETFDFLGFTHICAQGPDGKFRLVRRTSRRKRTAKLAALKEEIERRKHHRVAEQYAWLNQVLRGHYNYYGVPGNFTALASFRYRVRDAWHRALQRRSQRARWTHTKRDAFDARFPLPRSRLTQAHPLARFSRP
jgi:RNA-directed DNA polymerase